MSLPEHPVTVLAPAFNEETVLPLFVEAVVEATPDSWEILVVDDGSTDSTPRILRDLAAEIPRLRVLTHPENRGLGAALRTGIGEAEGEVLITIDADLSHPLSLLATLADIPAGYDAVYASRYVPGGGMESVPLHRQIISRTANLALRLLLRVPVRDLTTGYRAIRIDAIRPIALTADSFDIQLEMTVELARAGARFIEVPLVLENRVAGESKMRYLRLIHIYSATLLRLLRRRKPHKVG